MKNVRYKLPKAGTRVRAVFDLLCKNPDGVLRQAIKAAYDNCPPAYHAGWNSPRRHSSMEVSKLVKRFCNRTGTPGHYICKLKPEWAEVALKNPFYALSTTGVNIDKLEEIAGGSVRKGTTAFIDPPFTAGDWVKVTSTDPDVENAFKANGLKRGATYQVEKVTDIGGANFVHLSGCTGGWYPRHFTLVVRPPKAGLGPQNDKGSPEIRDMAWTGKSPEPLHNPFAHVPLEPKGYPQCHCGAHTWQHLTDPGYNARNRELTLHNVRELLRSEKGYSNGHFSDRPCVTEKYDNNYLEQLTKRVNSLEQENITLRVRNDQLRDELQTFSKELLAAEKNANEYKDAAEYVSGKKDVWEARLVELRKMVYSTQHAEVGHVYSMCDDMISAIDRVLEDIRSA